MDASANINQNVLNTSVSAGHLTTYLTEPELSINPSTLCRIQKIEVCVSDAIDQIKILYDDGTAWSHGHSSQLAEKRLIVFTNGEFIVRVTHEHFFNMRYAGAAIEFETNKRRVFSFRAAGIATDAPSEQTTINSAPDHEVICLKINHGVLVGVDQQPVPRDELLNHPKCWYVIAFVEQKEESKMDSCEEEVIRYEHFYSQNEAFKKWKGHKIATRTKIVSGRILIDCIKYTVLKKAGDRNCIQRCVTQANDTGFIAACTIHDESILGILKYILAEFARSRIDCCLFSFSIFLGLIVSWIVHEKALMYGYIITSIFSNNTFSHTPWQAKVTCDYIIQCNGSSMDNTKSLIVPFVLMLMLEALCDFLSRSFGSITGNRIVYKLQCKAFAHILSLDQDFFDQHSATEIREAMDIRELKWIISYCISNMMICAMEYFLIAYYLIKIDVYIGGISFLIICVTESSMLFLMWKNQKHYNKLYKKFDKAAAQILDDVLSMISSVKIFSKEQSHNEEYENCHRNIFKISNSLIPFENVTNVSMALLPGMMFGLSIYFGLDYIHDTNHTAGTLISFLLILQHAVWSFRNVISNYQMAITRHRIIQSFIKIMDITPGMHNGFMKPKNIEGDIEFDNIDFAYPQRPDEMVLKGFSLKIKPKTMTAIVGDSGAGKTTITKLLLRLYDPNSGSIKIDGVDIRHFDRSHLRKYMGVVNQNPFLFDKTIADNIAYGAINKLYTMEEVAAASKLAYCDFISKFRSGFQTFAGARGSLLSGGETQRIALARAAIRDPTILILDEATSSLDAENEKLVQVSLENILCGRTVLVFAHRLSTITNADEIICMKNGEVIERGTHKKLMKKTQRGIYYNLVQKQIIHENHQKVCNTPDEK